MVYIKKAQIKRMYTRVENKRIEDKLLEKLSNDLEEYGRTLIKNSLWINRITGRKTLQADSLEKYFLNAGLNYNKNEVFGELSKGTIKRLVQTEYDDRISDKYVQALINQIEAKLYEIITATIKISNIKGRKTVKLDDLNQMNKLSFEEIPI